MSKLTAKLKRPAKTPKQSSGFQRIKKYKIFRNSGKHLKLTEDDLINAESRLGALLFGPIPAGHRREFFRYRHNVWIYHEEWTENDKKMESTITYKVQENGVYKCPLGGEYIKIKDAELANFRKATREYLKLVKQKLYGTTPSATPSTASNTTPNATSSTTQK